MSMDGGVRVFEKIRPDIGYIDEILTFDARKLDATESATISKYAVALSQYLIYFRAETNRARISVHQKERALNAGIAQVLTKEVINRYKTKTAATDYVVSNSPELQAIRTDIDNLKDELMLVEGVDKMISDLVATLKRELTRRENELYTARKERYS
jgi:hypothetical protein